MCLIRVEVYSNTLLESKLLWGLDFGGSIFVSYVHSNNPQALLRYTRVTPSGTIPYGPHALMNNRIPA